MVFVHHLNWSNRMDNSSLCKATINVVLASSLRNACFVRVCQCCIMACIIPTTTLLYVVSIASANSVVSLHENTSYCTVDNEQVIDISCAAYPVRVGASSRFFARKIARNFRICNLQARCRHHRPPITAALKRARNGA